MNFEELEIGQKVNPIIRNYREDVKKQRKEIDQLRREINSLWKIISAMSEDKKC